MKKEVKSHKVTDPGKVKHRCAVCGFRIRGPQHDTGTHHKAVEGRVQ